MKKLHSYEIKLALFEFSYVINITERGHRNEGYYEKW